MIRNFHVCAINHRKTYTSCVEPTRRFHAGSTIMERIKKKNGVALPYSAYDTTYLLCAFNRRFLITHHAFKPYWTERNLRRRFLNGFTS